MTNLTKKFLVTFDEEQLKKVVELIRKSGVSETDNELAEWLNWILNNEGYLVATYQEQFDYDEVPF